MPGAARCFPGDAEGEPLVEVESALQVARDNDPLIDTLDSHGWSLFDARGGSLNVP
jgi:hypothetical protein